MSADKAKPVLVVDYGSPLAQLAARQIREAGLFSQVTTPKKAVDLEAGAQVHVGVPEGVEVDFTGVPLLVIPEGHDESEVQAAVAGLLAEDLEASPWNMAQLRHQLVAQTRSQVGDGHVLLGLSGGVDSSVAAALIQEAVGDQLTCVFVDHGLLRSGEKEEVHRDFAQNLGLNLIVVDAQERFLNALAGVKDPEEKRKIIGEQFIRVFEETATQLANSWSKDDSAPAFLAQGTIYPDVIESGGDGAKNIKSHHNVGGLPEDLNFELVEPLRMLFKTEVRELGRELGLPEHMVDRQPFPGPGLGVRVVGELTQENLETLRAADLIVREEVAAAGLGRDIWQFPVVLLADVHSTGVEDGERTYGHPVVLRPVTSQDAMTADWVRLPYEVLEAISSRITAEVPGVTRVVLDVTPKPPATIEWE